MADLGIIKNCIVNKISGFAYIGLKLLDRYLSLSYSDCMFSRLNVSVTYQKDEILY